MLDWGPFRRGHIRSRGPTLKNTVTVTEKSPTHSGSRNFIREKGVRTRNFGKEERGDICIPFNCSVFL